MGFLLMMRWRRALACGLFHSPLQKELVCIIPPSCTVILCSDCPVYMPAWVHEYPPAYVKYYTQEDTPATGSVAEPQWASPPRQLELPPPGAAEFVICDHTIETFFSDQKSRGFHSHKSHISDPQRLSRLLIAACLAYIWIIYLGSLCEKEGWRNVIHRRDRCDVSLFQLGLRLLEHFLNEDLPILVQFHVNI